MLLIGSCGYVGSTLYGELSKTRNITCVDIGRRGNPGNVSHLNLDYADLSQGELSTHQDIILLAGHSSVAECASDPTGAFNNNVVAFQRLLERLDNDQRLIYASSSSVYSGFGAAAASEDMPPGNMYDFTKLANDTMVTLSDKRCYGLRFGTVNGPSPNLRTDVMLNKMWHTAANNGYVQIANPKVRRPILGINDLTRAVTAILDGDGAPGIYNLASFNDEVAHLGAVVADQMDVPLILGESSPAYDFEITTHKFQEAYNFQFQETAISIVQSLVGAYGGNGRSDDPVHANAALSSV
jgi:nucleoside-diphosphate-sugar epimerase